jgi:hypothetical protein
MKGSCTDPKGTFFFPSFGGKISFRLFVLFWANELTTTKIATLLKHKLETQPRCHSRKQEVLTLFICPFIKQKTMNLFLVFELLVMQVVNTLSLHVISIDGVHSFDFACSFSFYKNNKKNTQHKNGCWAWERVEIIMFFSSFVMSHVRENFYFGTFQSFKIFL